MKKAWPSNVPDTVKAAFADASQWFQKDLSIKGVKNIDRLRGLNNCHLAVFSEVFGEKRLVIYPSSQNKLTIYGVDEQDIKIAAAVLTDLRQWADNRPKGDDLEAALKAHINRAIQNAARASAAKPVPAPAAEAPAEQKSQTMIRHIEPRNERQAQLLKAMAASDTVFALGTAGTGKTFLAMATALKMLNEGQVEKIYLTRPAMEAGEKLGFLPGDFKQKMDPFMDPLYDAAEKYFGNKNKLDSLLKAGKVEIVPFAFMRGRNFDKAFVILDEAQNTTVQQMKMFLTRLGEGSRMVISGDPDQCDFEDNRGRIQMSGLNDAVRVLRGRTSIPFIQFTEEDVVRSPRVKEIAGAYAMDRTEREAHANQNFIPVPVPVPGASSLPVNTAAFAVPVPKGKKGNGFGAPPGP